MATIRVAGLDPSLRNFGIVKGTLDLVTGIFRLDTMQLIESSADIKNKKVVRKNSDDLNRARTLTTGMNRILKDVDLVFIEIPVGSQSA